MHLDLDPTKPVLGVTDKARHKQSSKLQILAHSQAGLRLPGSQTDEDRVFSRQGPLNVGTISSSFKYDINNQFLQVHFLLCSLEAYGDACNINQKQI